MDIVYCSVVGAAFADCRQLMKTLPSSWKFYNEKNLGHFCMVRELQTKGIDWLTNWTVDLALRLVAWKLSLLLLFGFCRKVRLYPLLKIFARDSDADRWLILLGGFNFSLLGIFMTACFKMDQINRSLL